VINFGAVKLNRKSDFIINKTFSRCWSFHQQQKAGVEWLVRKLKDIFFMVDDFTALVGENTNKGGKNLFLLNLLTTNVKR
jgi:hypothetical protein